MIKKYFKTFVTWTGENSRKFVTWSKNIPKVNGTENITRSLPIDQKIFQNIFHSISQNVLVSSAKNYWSIHSANKSSHHLLIRSIILVCHHLCIYACLHSVQLGFQTSLHHQLWGVENWRKYKISICMSWTKQICGLYQPIPLKPTKLIRLVGGSLNLTHVTVPFALKPQLYASTVSNCKPSLFSFINSLIIM